MIVVSDDVMISVGVFRGVLPDLKTEVRSYLADTSADVCSHFMNRTYLGLSELHRGPMARLRATLGNSQHLWMWDFKGLQAELQAAGFVAVRRAFYGDSQQPLFSAVEEEDRWRDALGFECMRPV